MIFLFIFRVLSAEVSSCEILDTKEKNQGEDNSEAFVGLMIMGIHGG